MVIPKYLSFSWSIFIKNLKIDQNHYDNEFWVLGMVKIKFLKVKLQNTVTIGHYRAMRQERVKVISLSQIYWSLYRNKSNYFLWNMLIQKSSFSRFDMYRSLEQARNSIWGEPMALKIREIILSIYHLEVIHI